jgi:hypothetical protein
MSVGICVSGQPLHTTGRNCTTYATSFEVTKASPVHQASHNIHRHERPPVQHIHLSLSDCNIVHLVNSEARHLFDSIMPVFQQRITAYRPRKYAAPNRVVLYVCEGKHGPPRPCAGQLVVPITFHEVCADAMDVVETFDVTDCELVRSNADVWSVLLVE